LHFIGRKLIKYHSSTPPRDYGFRISSETSIWQSRQRRQLELRHEN